MKVLVTGFKGQLGFDVVKSLEKLGIECIGVDIDDFDLTDENQTLNYIKSYEPNIIVHCAAYTAVDKAEDEKEICHDVNVNGTKYIAKVCNEIDAKMVFISTDYVFEGTGENAYKPEDKKNPINYYGLTKSLAEDEIQNILEKYFILRISWVFGINGKNFVKTMLKLGDNNKEISVVSDQIGSPTYTKDLAKLICEMIKTDKYGIYHVSNEGYCSWYDFASEIMKVGKKDCIVNPVLTREYKKSVAKRPYNSRMDKSKLEENGFERLKNWKDALKYYIEDEIYIKNTCDKII